MSQRKGGLNPSHGPAAQAKRMQQSRALGSLKAIVAASLPAPALDSADADEQMLITGIELFVRYFIEQRSSSVDIPESLKDQKNYFSDFVESRAYSDPVALIGAGKMGGALLESWIALGLRPGLIRVVDPDPSEHLTAAACRYQIKLFSNICDLDRVSVLFFAVKPQEAETVLSRSRSFIGNRTLIVSIMAGKTIEAIRQKVDREAAIVRAMPNIAGSIGRGITAACCNELVSPRHAQLAYALLLATGPVEWVEDENLMDAVTAVSGSGPAYVFLLAEALEKAGKAAGLPGNLAAKLARHTIAGSGEMLRRSQETADTLRKNVTSPRGTTAAALEILMAHDGLEHLLRKAVAAAAKRSRELAG